MTTTQATGQTHPSYLSLYEKGELERRVEEGLKLLAPCRVCPVGCKEDRLRDEPGDCHVGRYALVASCGPHFGEEPVLTGWRGSGTVFFAGCNLRCVYCQNYDISQLRRGIAVSPQKLAEIFLEFQARGCHNLNLVTPSHVVPQVLEALLLAVPGGFRLPIVYNTSSYESMPSLRLLDDVVDIYMPDIKYSDASTGLKYSGVKSYPQVARKMIREMHRQVGDLVVDGKGVARRGLLIRHLVLPYDIAGSREAIAFIARELSVDSYVNVMDQYRPQYRAFDFPELSLPFARKEYWQVVEYALELGIHRGVPFDNLNSYELRKKGAP